MGRLHLAEETARPGERRAGEEAVAPGGEEAQGAEGLSLSLSPPRVSCGGPHEEVGVTRLWPALSWCLWPQQEDFDKQHASWAQGIHPARISGWPSLGTTPSQV